MHSSFHSQTLYLIHEFQKSPLCYQKRTVRQFHHMRLRITHGIRHPVLTSSRLMPFSPWHIPCLIRPVTIAVKDLTWYGTKRFTFSALLALIRLPESPSSFCLGVSRLCGIHVPPHNPAVFVMGFTLPQAARNLGMTTWRIDLPAPPGPKSPAVLDANPGIWP